MFNNFNNTSQNPYRVNVSTSGATNLIMATRAGDISSMTIFIGQCNTCDEHGNTPLHYAAAAGFRDGISLLLTHHCYVDPVNKIGLTPLILAMQNQHHNAALVLLEAGASPFYLSPSLMSGIGLAVASGNLPLILMMISRQSSRINRQLALYKIFSDVAISEMIDKVDILLFVCRADIHYPVFNLNPPLAISATLGNIEMVEKWIEVGAPLERRDTNGLTPLMNAAIGGFLPICELLVSSGAKLNTTTDGRTALSMALQFGHTDVVEYLLTQAPIANNYD